MEYDIQYPPLASACTQGHTHMCTDHIHTYTQMWAKIVISPEKVHITSEHGSVYTDPTVSREMQTTKCWECTRKQPVPGRAPTLLLGAVMHFLKHPVRHTPTGVLRLQSGSPGAVCTPWPTAAAGPTV